MSIHVRRASLGLGGLVLVLLGVALVFTSALAVLAFAAPLVGLFWFVSSVRGAMALWRTGGRLPAPGGGVQIVEASRTRGLALTQVGSGLAGLALTCVPALFVFASGWHALWAAVGGTLLRIGATIVRSRLLAGARPVEVLPPDPPQAPRSY